MDAVDLAVDGRNRAANRNGRFVVVELSRPRHIIALAD